MKLKTVILAAILTLLTITLNAQWQGEHQDGDPCGIPYGSKHWECRVVCDGPAGPCHQVCVCKPN